MAKHKVTRGRSGLLPGEFRRRSLVSLETALLDTGPRHYIVETRRLDGLWSHRVTYQGQVWDIPGQVVARLLAQRDSIIKENRSRQARDRVLAQAQAVVKAQEE